MVQPTDTCGFRASQSLPCICCWRSGNLLALEALTSPLDVLGLQKSRLEDAVLAHERARAEMRSARTEFRRQRVAFLAKPANLLFPFAGGILLTAGQIKNVPKGINRLPFLNIAKAGVGVYALVVRLQNLVSLQNPSKHNTDSSKKTESA